MSRVGGGLNVKRHSWNSNRFLRQFWGSTYFSFRRSIFTIWHQTCLRSTYALSLGIRTEQNFLEAWQQNCQRHSKVYTEKPKPSVDIPRQYFQEAASNALETWQPWQPSASQYYVCCLNLHVLLDLLESRDAVTCAPRRSICYNLCSVCRQQLLYVLV
jgi:hypothetical protein